MERKQDIRKVILKKRNSLTEPIHEKYSTLIEGRLFSMPSYQNAEILLIYASYQSEVSTYGIMKKAFEDKKKVFCPKVLSQGIMEFYEITSMEDITKGYKNIPEPILMQNPYRGVIGTKTLMIMPLVGFDMEKNRLGYGGGFYDRYIQRFPNLQRIGLGFECQKTEFIIPAEETDRKPEFIITENEIY